MDGGVGVFPGLQLLETKVQLLPFHRNEHVLEYELLDELELELDGMSLPFSNV